MPHDLDTRSATDAARIAAYTSLFKHAGRDEAVRLLVDLASRADQKAADHMLEIASLKAENGDLLRRNEGLSSALRSTEAGVAALQQEVSALRAITGRGRRTDPTEPHTDRPEGLRRPLVQPDGDIGSAVPAATHRNSRGRLRRLPRNTLAPALADPPHQPGARIRSSEEAFGDENESGAAGRRRRAIQPASQYPQALGEMSASAVNSRASLRGGGSQDARGQENRQDLNGFEGPREERDRDGVVR
ncbi:hypothetical protein AM571_PA00349 (plasmid) [Rhizobium etli 8C-3]|uniref:Uncharacterized protein n=1 Tax=Rhizobium etli 8C-3 TaxID=538025 RepID=A0A1L5PAQ1_RHIET|nr:hypothetical protein AM571_PA00349 [Rhizobium etli 8C-3]